MALNRIWVYAEAADGKVAPITLEILTKARELGHRRGPLRRRRRRHHRRGPRRPRRHPALRHRRPPGLHPGRAGRVGHRRARRGRRAAGPHPVRHHLRGPRRRRPPVGGARPAGHHQQHRHRGGRRRGRRHRAGVRRHQAGPHQVHGQRPAHRPDPAQVVRGRDLGRGPGRGRHDRGPRLRHRQGQEPPRRGDHRPQAGRGRRGRVRRAGPGRGREVPDHRGPGRALKGAPVRPGPSSTPAGCPTATRWARPARS